MNRRRFILWLSSFVGAASIFRWVTFPTKPEGNSWIRNVESFAARYSGDIRAVVSVLLPSSLKAEQFTGNFLDFLRGQNPDADVSYLLTIITADNLALKKPGTKWPLIDGSAYIRQIEAWRLQTRVRTLEELTAPQMKALLLEQRKINPAFRAARPDGKDLLLDLLSFYYFRPEALDQFYGRQIGLYGCRGYGTIGEIPPSV